MIEIRKTPAFDAWFDNLSDRKAKVIIARRLDRIVLGLFGDVEPIGAGVSELRIHYGPGYRVYLMRRSENLVILLGGGDKSTQRRDIRRAIALSKEEMD